MKFRGTYEVENTTSHSIKFRHRQIGHRPISTSPAPYFYIKKFQWEKMDYPEVIELVVSNDLADMGTRPYYEYRHSGHETEKYVRYSHFQEDGTPLRQSPVPYYYLKKYQVREMGNPASIYVLVVPRLPEVED